MKKGNKGTAGDCRGVGKELGEDEGEEGEGSGKGDGSR